MNKDLQNYIIEKTNEMLSFDFCCSDLKLAANNWLNSIGTDKEQQAISDYITECEDCLMPVDELIEFCKGELPYFIFGDSQAEELDHAYKLKAGGAKYCDCPVCTAALDILDKKREMTENIIRKFINSDRDVIMQIWMEENIKAHDFISKDFWVNNYNYVKSVLPNAKIYVYKNRDEILGFIGLKSNYIEGIFVKSNSQNKGIGTALLNKAKQINSQLTLNVYKKNVKAFNFYLKNGFKIIEENVDTQTKEKEYKMIWKKEK